MKQKKWLKIYLSLFIVAFSISSQFCSAQLVHAYPNDQYQMMNLPFDQLVPMNESMNTPAAGFAVIDGTNDQICYGLPESMIKRVGNFYDDDGNDGNYYQFPGTYLLGLEFAAGRFIAIKKSYGGVSFFAVPEAPFEYTNLLLDIKGFKLEGSNWAGSIGIGFRHTDRHHKKIYGVNFFYDYLDQHGTFNQVGLGFELFSQCWEFHLNGYLPLGTTHHAISERVINFKAGFVGIFSDVQNALRGVEFTAGGRWNFFDNINLYVAPGAYFYHNKDIRKNIQGAQGTVEVNWNDWISFRLNASYDRVFRGRLQGVIALSLPLDYNYYCCCKNTCECCRTCDCLAHRIRRNDLIFLKTCCSVEKNWDDCGRLINNGNPCH